MKKKLVSLWLRVMFWQAKRLRNKAIKHYDKANRYNELSIIHSRRIDDVLAKIVSFGYGNGNDSPNREA